ncbi:MAG TPA: TlpA disulfide reductase family protein [Pyrinomonadaceae bacterium]|nr:TlpA disulfide reductase family protein [Pyrinomonadaceae bacterium]
MKRFFLLTFLCAALLFAAASARAQGQAAGQLVPPPDSSDLKLRGADGKTYDVGSMRGQVVLVSFGATWCLPCKEELKALEQLKKEYKDKPVKFIWISIESEEDVSDGDLRNYAKGLKLSFPVLRDPDKAVFSRYSPRLRMPTVLFFDREGKLSLPNHVGMADAPVYMAKMRARLDKLLTEEAATRPRRVGG